MVTSILKQFEVKDYNDLYNHYMNGNLGVIEQRIGVIPKWEGNDDLELIKRLLEMDNDNLYSVSVIKRNKKDTFLISILGVGFVKKFNKPVCEYEMYFGEDGKFEHYYEIDEPTISKDGTLLGEVNIFPTK